MAPSVTITDTGREGRVQYSEGPQHTIGGYWEFGGGEVVTIVSMGTLEEWQRDHAWAVERRSSILRRVADEVVRQRAPSCTAEVDEVRGDILVRRAEGTATTEAHVTTPQAQAASFTRRYTNIKAMVGIGVLVIALVVGAVLWMGKKVLTVAPASGVPLNECVRTDTHIASLIQYTDPHLPRISGRGGNTTTSLSILLIPLDGSRPQVVPIVGQLDGNGYQLARILGSDGHTLWFDANGFHGVRLHDYTLITPEHLRDANPGVDPSWWEDARGMDIVGGRLHIINADRSAALDVDPATWKATSVAPIVSNARFERDEPTDHLAAGSLTTRGTWLGLHSAEDLQGEYKVGKHVRTVEAAEDAKQLRRLYSATVEPSSDGAHLRILGMEPLSDAEYLNAAFLRMEPTALPIPVSDPDGVLMVYTSKPGLGGTLVVARVDLDGTVRWSVDTGIERFGLQQILPGMEQCAFVGTRPPVPDKLSEPLVVLVDNATGERITHSLWR